MDKSKILILELAVIIILSSLVIFSNLGKGSLANYDEAIYGEVSKEILQTGDWLTLHYDSAQWFQKPPLFFWLVAITYKLFGISTFTSRFWPAFFGIATIIITFFLAKKLSNHIVAFMSSLILLASSQFLHSSRMLMLDIPSAFFITLSLYIFLITQEKEEGIFYYIFGAVLGLGVMIKGVMGLLPIPVILLYLLFTKNLKSIFRKEYLKALLSFLIIVLPWHLLQLILNKSAFINEYFWYHVVKRAVSAIELHDYGNIFYLFVLEKGLGLWLLILLPSAIFLLYKRGSSNLLLISWISVILGIFLIAKTKLPWYLIPLYPAFAIAISSFLYKIRIKKIPIGFFIFIIVFLISFHIPEPLFCSNSLSNINMIGEGNLQVHSSVGKSPAEMFYFGLTRQDNFVLDNKSFYVSHNLMENGNMIYNEGGYMLSVGADHAGNVSLETISRIPETQREPERICYAFMPMNLEVPY